MTLTFARLREATVGRTTSAFGHPLHVWSEDDWITALLGEVGEAANIVKKLNRERDGLGGNTRSEDELIDDLADELGDAVHYLDLHMAKIGRTFEQEFGLKSFVEMRNYTASYAIDEEFAREGSGIVRRMIRALRTLDEEARGAPLLELLDLLALRYDINLGVAVALKFNRVSERRGLSYRLEAS